MAEPNQDLQIPREKPTCRERGLGCVIFLMAFGGCLFGLLSWLGVQAPETWRESAREWFVSENSADADFLAIIQEKLRQAEQFARDPETRDKAKQYLKDVGESVEQWRESAEPRVRGWLDSMKDKAGQALESLEENTEEAQEQISEMAQDAAEQASDADFLNTNKEESE